MADDKIKLIKEDFAKCQKILLADCQAPQWFINGIDAVQKAPSAMNRQPVKFEYKAGEIRTLVEESYRFDLIDMGIAKAHFSIATGGRFELGNRGKYIAP